MSNIDKGLFNYEIEYDKNIFESVTLDDFSNLIATVKSDVNIPKTDITLKYKFVFDTVYKTLTIPINFFTTNAQNLIKLNSESLLKGFNNTFTDKYLGYTGISSVDNTKYDLHLQIPSIPVSNNSIKASQVYGYDKLYIDGEKEFVPDFKDKNLDVTDFDIYKDMFNNLYMFVGVGRKVFVTSKKDIVFPYASIIEVRYKLPISSYESGNPLFSFNKKPINFFSESTSDEDRKKCLGCISASNEVLMWDHNKDHLYRLTNLTERPPLNVLLNKERPADINITSQEVHLEIIDYYNDCKIIKTLKLKNPDKFDDSIITLKTALDSINSMLNITKYSHKENRYYFPLKSDIIDSKIFYLATFLSPFITYNDKFYGYFLFKFTIHDDYFTFEPIMPINSLYKLNDLYYSKEQNRLYGFILDGYPKHTKNQPNNSFRLSGSYWAKSNLSYIDLTKDALVPYIPIKDLSERIKNEVESNRYPTIPSSTTLSEGFIVFTHKYILLSIGSKFTNNGLHFININTDKPFIDQNLTNTFRDMVKTEGVLREYCEPQYFNYPTKDFEYKCGIYLPYPINIDDNHLILAGFIYTPTHNCLKPKNKSKISSFRGYI